MEDFAQVFGRYPNHKYKFHSYANIAAVLWAEAGEEAVVINQDYGTRPGYDPEFLDGITVPLPKLTTESMASDTAEGGGEGKLEVSRQREP